MTFFGFRKVSVFICLFGVLCSCGGPQQFLEPLPDTVDFNFHVRPILVQNCYLCHGPDSSGRKAELRLDIFEGATAELEDGGYAIVPGKPSKSQLVHRINHKDDDQVMPPPETNHKLSEREKALLEKWIDQGAEWKDHWAFLKPEISDPNAAALNIDAYIDARIEEKGLVKSPLANKNALIRRLSYILTGLPPSPNAIQNFIADTSENAYENLVDHYLNSPAYGERWARHWMDLIRYAETKGHEFDYEITGAWKYRDYLIRAFNDDIPYNQLVKEHLAGDLLDLPRYNEKTGTLESHLGTAFYAMGEGTHSPVDIQKDEADRIDNIIDVTSKTFLGLTVSCARCHDHKFDPILTADYYSLYGVIQSTRFSPLSVDHSYLKENTHQEIQELKKYIRKTVAEKWEGEDLGMEKLLVKDDNPSIKAYATQNTRYNVLGDFGHTGLDGWKSDGLAFGEQTTLGNPLIQGISGELKSLDEGKVSSKFYDTGIFGVLRSPNFVLDSDFIGVRARGAKSTIRIIIDNFQLIQNPIYGNLTQKINEPNWKNHVFNVAPWKGHKAYIEILPGGYSSHSYELPIDAYVEAQYAISYDTEWPSEIKKKEESIANKMNLATLDISSKQIKTLNNLLQQKRLPSQFPELRPIVDSINKLALKLKSNSFIYGVSDGFAVNSPIFNRGNHQEPSEDSIPQGFLSALPLGKVPFKSQGSGRLELADAILSSDNPLTARVMVNRIWHYLFGKGIVETVDNFGLQGKLPSHPELLDYLAVKFKTEGWSIKSSIKHIVLSETFKRSTSKDKGNIQKDADNLYLACFPVRRLEAEAFRDGLLATSESLDSTLYGPPVATYLTDFMQGRGRPSKSGPLNGDNRRSIYLEVRRNFLEPMMTTFDRPIPFSTFGKRDVTNVPSQSLIIMNNPFVAKRAEIMAQKLLAQGELSFEDRIEWIYVRAFSRKPTIDELGKATEFIEMLKNMEHQQETEMDEELMIWKEYCHSIFNLKEFLYLI